MKESLNAVATLLFRLVLLDDPYSVAPGQCIQQGPTSSCHEFHSDKVESARNGPRPLSLSLSLSSVTQRTP